jgi:hypothetical protein
MSAIPSQAIEYGNLEIPIFSPRIKVAFPDP